MVILQPPKDTLRLLREAMPSAEDCKPLPSDALEDENEEVLAYVAALAASLADEQDFDSSTWIEALSPYLSSLPSMTDDASSEDTVEKFRLLAERAAMGGDDDESYGSDDDSGEELCNIRFSLAYGGKILLHQTKLRLRRGRRYALVGQNGAGKTTLMNAINNGKLDGWPNHLRTEYVDSGSNVDPVYEAKNVFTHLTSTTKRSGDACREMLGKLKFTQIMMDGTIGELSGGWQMKLRLAKAVLIDADILLLDEPTNHLDKGTVQWLMDYLEGLKDTTVIIVSHDTPFLEEVCTDVIHYEQRASWGPHRKLVLYRGKMSVFVKKIPQAKHYFELSTTDLKFVFPDPGRLEGIRTSTQKFLEMDNVDFRYPGAEKNTLTGVNLKMSLSSRVAVLGANGAGKTTLVKMMVGDTQPTNIGNCRLFIHHNLRVAYVSQHAFFHVEQHMEESPAAYIQWRFKDAYDKEKIQSASFKISDEEQQAIDDFGLEAIWSRRLRAGNIEYEVKKKNVPERDNKYYTKDELLNMGFVSLIKQTDEKIAAKEAGLDLRPCTTKEIQKHLDDFGLVQEFGTYGKIRGLSGGQKVKLVLAAAMWNCPHLLVLDEPTNYLDREALGALSSALNEWGGSVLMISHNKEFYSSVCKEEWIVGDGQVKIEGISTERKMKAVAKKKVYEKEVAGEELLEKVGGNVNACGDKYKDATTNFWGKAVSKKEARQYDKAKKKGDVALMRKILHVPMGKIMPGYEELGDGKTPPPS
uniref:ABC transporter domain-containing protein n=2 Tax=Ditylum brightwellii TaxID=49249 RepID=A0A6U3TRP6_9STRA|mmetsp:Transcript_38075/g.56967  ORF Transcript_38075/g.56967 Transcript_38075/m.56967 type:complete len:752 (+) Transcript_38075:153-2408(+)